MNNNEQHAIDIKVRQALENLEIPYKADHWQSMAGKLDELDAEETRFDKDLSSKLAQLEMPYNALHWNQMSGKLADLDSEETAFDNSLSTKLAEISIPYQAANWSDMSDRLDNLDASETGFDTLFKQKLAHSDVKYQPKHWDLMAEKIEENFSWRAKIMRYKVVEVALVLLTLFTVGNMLDLPFDSEYTGVERAEKGNETKKENNERKINKATPKKIQDNKSFYNPTDWRNRPASPNNKEAEQNVNSKPIVATDMIKDGTPLLHNMAITAQNGAENGENKAYNNTANETLVIAQSTQTSDPSVTPTIPNIVPSSGLVEVKILPEIVRRKVVAIGQVRDGSEESTQDIQVGTLANARILNPMYLLKPSLLNTEFYDDKIVFPIQKEKRAKWRLNIFGLPLADLVKYNYVVEKNTEKKRQNVANLGSGIAVAYKKDKLEIEGGLTYLDKKYDLPNVEFVSGNFKSNYTIEKPLNIRLSIVSIPLSTNYTFKETRRWSFYTRVGAAINTIFKSKEDQFVQQSDPFASGPKPPASEYEPNVYPKGILEKDFFKNRNWINGGLKENTYLTANAGIGIEYRLTHNTDIYLQPTFDYHFSKRGVGSLNDRINSFSVQGGVKTKLK